jgi:hypothetical protein
MLVKFGKKIDEQLGYLTEEYDRMVSELAEQYKKYHQEMELARIQYTK